MLPPTIKGKARRREGDAAVEGKRFRRSRLDLLFIEYEEGRGCSLKLYYKSSWKFSIVFKYNISKSHSVRKVALVLDDLSLEVLRPYSSDKDVGNIEHKLFYSLSMPVKPLSDQDSETNDNSILSVNSCESISTLEGSTMTKNSSISVFIPNSNDHSVSSQDELSQTSTPEKSGNDAKLENKYVISLPMMQKQRNPQRSSDSPTKMPKEETTHEFVEFHLRDESFNTKQDKSALTSWSMNISGIILSNGIYLIIWIVFLSGAEDVLLPLRLHKVCVIYMKSVRDFLSFIWT
ncbi:unnamed protein product [Fraxinus pennsylvanica]|uniref:Uncharacterized protein n=1 Tax=Fraxinus pennsylvanica TaxID=56036 RepID=A0AAD2A3T7_9LAMI|nr:unnamed protein product [Fraxinus pennsylvanica]